MEILRASGSVGGQGDFHFQSAFGTDSQSRRVASKEIVLKSGEEYPVTVLFAPQKLAPREASLRIRQLEKPMKYTVSTQLGGYRLRREELFLA